MWVSECVCEEQCSESRMPYMFELLRYYFYPHNFFFRVAWSIVSLRSCDKGGRVLTYRQRSGRKASSGVVSDVHTCGTRHLWLMHPSATHLCVWDDTRAHSGLQICPISSCRVFKTENSESGLCDTFVQSHARGVVRSMDPRSKLLGLKSQLCYSLPM